VRLAYVDTSYLLSIAFGERGSAAHARRLEAFDLMISSNLLEAELRSAFGREGISGTPAALAAVSWILPDRPLSDEVGRVLAAGHVRGADCWHLACALYAAESPGEISFLTLDDRQRKVADALLFGR